LFLTLMKCSVTLHSFIYLWLSIGDEETRNSKWAICVKMQFTPASLYRKAAPSWPLYPISYLVLSKEYEYRYD
jgi:hypothetical protein